MNTQSSKAKIRLAAAAFLTFIAGPLAHADYSSTVVSQGPIGYWRLNETLQPPPGVLATNQGSLGAVANGSYVNFPIRGLTGPFTGSTAVGVDGSQDISVGYQAALNPANFTIEAWVNPASATVPGGLLCVAASMHSASPRSGWLIYQSDGTAAGAAGVGYYLRLYATNGAATSISLLAPQTVVAGTWTHLVFTFDGTTAKAYINGALVGSGAPSGFVPNGDAPFTIGIRSDTGFPWPGRVAEVAYFSSALSAARISAHYSTANTTPANYGTTVLSDSPIVYYRFQEPIDPPTANLGSFGSAANGLFIYDTQAGVAGPSSPPYVGFEAANKAASFDAGGGVVRIPALNLNTNTVTISGWVKANGPQTAHAAIVACKGTSTEVGLTVDVLGGLGLGYIWDGQDYGWSPSSDFGFPPLPDGDWAYVALVIQPTNASIYFCDANNFADFTSITNTFQVTHAVQAFDGATTFGNEAGATNRSFNGVIDEVAIFNRALGAGELYTQYGAAVGGVAPKIFTDLQGPSGPVAAGDPIVLTVDAGGTPSLTYTWRKNGSTIGTTSSGVFTIPVSALTDAGNYDVTISNGSGSAPSQQVSVTVISPTIPSITGTSGFRNRTLYTGGTINMSVTATGGGLKYQWYKNTVAISGATASGFTIASVVTSNAGSYSVSVTNSLGTASNGPAIFTIPTAAAGSYEAAVIAAHPEAWWRLDETAGSTNLFDGMGRHDGYYTNLNGTVPPVALGAAGINANSAASFTASGGVGVIPFAPTLNGQKYTYEGWVKTTVLNQLMVPYSSSFASKGVFWAEVPNGFWTPDAAGGYYPISPQVPIAPGVWTHLVMTYDSSIVDTTTGTHFPLAFFINGLSTTPGFTWSNPDGQNSGGPIIIGGHGVSATTLADLFFSGQVDEVAVYTRVLSATEITNHFVVGFPATPPTFAGAFIPQTVSTGKSVSFSTTVQGSLPIKLQWYKNGSLIAGATTNSIAFTNTAVSDTATYTLWATNSVGTNFQSVNLTVIPATGYANVTNNLVLHLRFDGNTADTSGRGNNGTAVNSPSFVTGLIGPQAIQYTTLTNGASGTNSHVTSSSYVVLGRPADLQLNASASFSISLWVNQTNGAEFGDLPFIGTETNSANNPGWILCPSYHAGGWQWNLNDSTNNLDLNGPNDSINNAQWHNFVLSVDRSANIAKTYLDGVMVAQADITGLGNLDNGGPIVIGQDPTGLYPEAGQFSLDDVGLWRRALTALEVAQLESAGRTAGRSFDTVAPAAVTLTISKSGSNITISWPSGTLYQSDSIGTGAVWTAVPGASAPSYTFTPGSGNKFYRVQ
jgi:Concanavalin A-like lectin/glucanases superfamily/Immunoglobulin I-set domain/Immunoglobulin domain